MRRRGNRYEWLGLALLALAFALFRVFWPVSAALLVLAGVCLVGSIRGWRFPGEPPPPDPLEGLSRKARRYVELDPEWSVDFLEPVVTHAMSEPVPFSGLEARWTLLATIPLRNAQREPVVELPGLGAELTFYRDRGKLVHERVEARWSSNRLPQARQELEPEVRRLRTTGEAEPIDVAARIDDESAGFVHTADATRGGRKLRLDAGQYYVRVRITGAPDQPVGWYRLSIPLIAGLELVGPVDPPSWAPREKQRRAPAGPRAVPRKKSGSQRPS